MLRPPPPREGDGGLSYIIDPMTWADKRRIIILSIVAVALAIVIAVLSFFLFYTPPSCTDGKQNGEETGIDCDGTCAYVCTVGLREPSISFTRAFSPSTERTDVISYINNPNPGLTVQDVPYVLELYTRDNLRIAKVEGKIDLGPGATPLYVPKVYQGPGDIGQAFLTLATSSMWYRYQDDRIIPKYNFDAAIEGEATPRITATLTNPSAYTLREVLVIATVFDAAGNALAASQNVIPSIAPQGIAGAVFTWNLPFSASPTRIDVVPIIPLPAYPKETGDQ